MNAPLLAMAVVVASVWAVPTPMQAQATEPATRRVRPPDVPGRRGLVSVPAWFAWCAAGGVAAAAAGTLLAQARRDRRR